MPKAKKYSLDYWVKKCMNAWSPEKDILAAVQEFVKSGTHSQIEFSGTPLEFATALYVSRFKRGTPWTGFFPTPTAAAERAASLLPINRGAVVLDPGCGFGALSHAVQQHSAVPIMVEYSSAVAPIAQAIWGEERVQYRDFLDGFRPTEFDAIVINPPFGNVFGHSDAAGDFLDRIADLSRGGTYVSAILPRGYLAVERPKRRVEIAQRFTIIDREDWLDDVFMPLTKISTTLYLLTVKRDGRLIGEVLPRPASSGSVTVQGWSAAEADPGCPDESADEADEMLAEPVDDDDAADADPAAVDDAPLPANWRASRAIDLEVEGEPVRVEYHGQASVFASRGGLTFDLHGPTVSPTGFRAHLTTYTDVAEHGSPEAAAQHIAHTLHVEHQAFLIKNRRSWPLDLPDRVEVKIGETVSYARPISWSEPNRRWEMWLIGAGEGRSVKPDQILTPASPPKKSRAKSKSAPATPWKVGAPVTVPAGWQQPLKFEFTLDGQSIRVEYHGASSLGFQAGQLQFGFFGKALSNTGFYNIFATYAEVAHCGTPEMAAIELARLALHELTASTGVASNTADIDAEFEGVDEGFEAEAADDLTADETDELSVADSVPEPVTLTQPPLLWKQPKFYPAQRGDQTVIVVARGVDDVQAEVQRGAVLLNPVGFDSRAEAVAWLDQQTVKLDPRAALPAGLAERLTAAVYRELKADRTGRADFFEAWRDEVLMLMRPNRQPGTPWVACYATPEGEYVALPRTPENYVQGATLFEALDALRKHLAAWQIPTSVYLRPSHPDWTSAALDELFTVVQTHERVIIADTDLGLPTIHDLPHPEHKGFGMFVSVTDEYTVNWDAGGAMQRLSNQLGWTTVQIERGTYPYDQAAVLDTLSRWQLELAALEYAQAAPVQPSTVTAAQADQHAVCSHCQAVHSDVRQALKAGWVIDAPYLFCAKCVASGIHAPSRTAGTDLAVTAVLPVPDYLPTDYARAEWQRTLDAFEAARGKEPWQMTRDEFFATHRPFSDGAQQHTLLQLIVNHEFDVVATAIDNEPVSAHILQLAVDYLDRLRETLVQIALAEGKPVPSEVLREFPDLVAAQRKRDASPSAIAANDSAALDQPDEHDAEVAAEKTPAKKSRKKAPAAAAPALDIPAVWHDPADFGIVVDGEEALVHYDGRDNTGFDHGSLWFEFRGPTISSTGYRSHFANLKDVQASGSPQAAARDIAARLAVELAAEVKKSRKKWPLKPVEDMAVQVEGAVRRAKLISWNDFNEWWSVWLRRERESAQVKQADVIGGWTTYFASHLNPGDHVVYRSVSTVLHGQVVRVVPGSACVVEVQQQPNVSHTNLVSPGDLIGLWDELSPAERGETFEVPTFGLARNPFDMDRATFDAWVQAADPTHGVEWSQAYRYFAERYALDDAGWSFFENNPHFIEKRRAIDPHLTGNPFDAPQDQFIRWLQSHAAGTEAQAAYLMGYAHLTSGSEVVLPEAKAYLATQPLYTAALAARQAAAEKVAAATEPVAALLAVDALCRFNDARDWEIWYNQHRADIPCFIPPAPLPSRYEIFEIRVGLTADRLKAYLRRGARVEFKDMRGDPHVGEFEKWQRNGAALINQFNAQHEIAGSFSVSLERIETITLDFTDKPKADRAAAKPVVVKRPTGLPADVPEVIEIDVGGRQPVWVLATIIKVAGAQLTCQRQDDQSTLKTPLYGRDIVWRVPMTA